MIDRYLHPENLFEQGIQDVVTRGVGTVAGARLGGGGKAGLVDTALGITVKWDAHVLESYDSGGSLLANGFNHVLVGEICARLHGVETMRLPRIVTPEARVYAALSPR
jgi:hypothetical protein